MTQKERKRDMNYLLASKTRQQTVLTFPSWPLIPTDGRIRSGKQGNHAGKDLRTRYNQIEGPRT